MVIETMKNSTLNFIKKKKKIILNGQIEGKILIKTK